MDCLADSIVSRKYLVRSHGASRDPVHIDGVGIRETMPPIIADRPQGTGDRMLMFFYDPVIVKLKGAIRQVPGGSLILWPDQAAHYYGNPERPYTHSWIHFYGPAAERFLQLFPIPEEVVLPLPEPDVWERMLYLIWHELTSRESNGDLLAELLKTMLMGLSRDLTPGRMPFIPEKIKLVYRFLAERAEHAENGCTLQEAAEAASLSIPQLCALFRKYYQDSPLSCYRKFVMNRAEDLLLNRNLNVSEVAELCGYRNIWQFSRAYKHHFGIAPSRRSRQHC